jgi:hypothetical protein
MESVYHIVAIRVNETSWAHVWRLRSRYLGTGYDTAPRSAHSAQAALAYFPKGVFSSTLNTPVETPYLSHITAMWGLPVSSISLLTLADRCHFSSSSLATPHRPASPSDAARAITHPAIIPSLNPPHNLAPVFNGVKAINAAVTPPRPSPHLIPSLLSFFVPSSALAMSSSHRRSLPPVRRLIATPLSPVSTSLAPPQPARPPPPSPVSIGELQHPCATRRRGAAAPSIRGPPWTGSVRGPPRRGLGPRNFPLKIKSKNRLF